MSLQRRRIEVEGNYAGLCDGAQEKETYQEKRAVNRVESC